MIFRKISLVLLLFGKICLTRLSGHPSQELAVGAADVRMLVGDFRGGNAVEELEPDAGLQIFAPDVQMDVVALQGKNPLLVLLPVVLADGIAGLRRQVGPAEVGQRLLGQRLELALLMLPDELDSVSGRNAGKAMPLRKGANGVVDARVELCLAEVPLV